MHEDEATIAGQPPDVKAVLVVRQGAQAGMSFPLTKGNTALGREESSTVVLQDPEASRRHAQIDWRGGQFVIEDLSSTNGTYVNGTQITAPQTLQSGDSIGIGQTALVFQIANQVANQATAGGVVPPYAVANIPPFQSPAATYNQQTLYTPPNGLDRSDTLQYMLYGFGCLFSLGICALTVIIAVIVLYPELLAGILQS